MGSGYVSVWWQWGYRGKNQEVDKGLPGLRFVTQDLWFRGLTLEVASRST